MWSGQELDNDLHWQVIQKMIRDCSSGSIDYTRNDETTFGNVDGYSGCHVSLSSYQLDKAYFNKTMVK